jgi:CCR4-NOT transcription complex subunit 3
MPQPSDTEWKRYKPLHPTQVPASFPRQQHDKVVGNAALMRKLDPECLFFAFYFQPGTYQQVRKERERERECVCVCVRPYLA